MSHAKQFALTHVVVFVLCACNAADRLVCALGHLVQSENDFCAAIGSEEKLFSLFYLV